MEILKILFFAIILLLIAVPFKSFAQEENIVPYLQDIEAGKKEEAIKALLLLKNKNPNDPSVMYLEGVLTEKGSDAVKIYQKILDQYPQSKYADASLYRIFTYNYALGNYSEARNDYEKLKKDYPISPYIKIAEHNFPNDQQTELTENKSSKPQEEVKLEEKPNYKYTIQAGAFTQPSNADALKKSFESNDYFSEIKDKNVAGTLFKVVYVGEFETKEEAQNFLQTVNSQFKLNGRVTDLP
jgi:tetratricopeptide (TPR) repeat protein